MENANFSAFQSIKNSFQANSSGFGLVYNAGKTCYFPDKAAPSIELVCVLSRQNHFVQFGNNTTKSACKISSQKTRQLADVILQSGYTPVHGLALGVHGVIVAPALLACGYERLRKKVVADGHALDFLHRFAGVICQDLIDIDARIGKLLDVYRCSFAHVCDLLQVCSHAG